MPTSKSTKTGNKKTVDGKTVDKKTVDKKTVDKKTVTKKTTKKNPELENLDALADKSQDWDNKSSEKSEDESNSSDNETSVDSQGADDNNADDNDEDNDDNDDGNDDDDDNGDNGGSKDKSKESTVVTANPVKTYNKDENKRESLLGGRVTVTKQAPTRFNTSHRAKATDVYHTNTYSDKPTNSYHDKPTNSSYNDKSARNHKSIAKFAYNEYGDSTMQLKDATVADLLKTAIVKSHAVGQKHLMDVLYQTLKATNMECEFPLTTDTVRKRTHVTKNTYANKDRNGRPRDDY